MTLLLQDTLVISPATVNKIEQEIEDLRAASDCADVVGTYAELEEYDTSTLTDNAIIKILADEEHDDAQTYYKWHKDDEEFEFIGELGPFYTKDESDVLLDTKVDKNAAITGATKTKITYDSKGLVTAGDDLSESDIPNLHLSKISDVTASAEEVNVLDGITASTAELNILDGVTASTSEINTLDGITASTSELNILDGATLTTTELNYVDGVTSSIQTQLDNKRDKVTSASKVYATDSSSNQSSISYDTSNTASTIAQRDANSQLNVNLTPTADNNATSKKYVDDRVNAAITEAVAFKGIVADETLLPSSGNVNGDMYWITAFSSNPPTGMTKGNSGSAIYKGDPDNKFFYTEDAIYQPDEQTIDLNGNGKLAVLISETAGNTITSNNDGLYVDQSGKVDKVNTTNRVYGTDANGAQTTYDKNSFGQVDDVKVDNVSVVTNKIASIDLSGKQNKPTITASTGATLSVTLADNTIFNNTNAGLTTLTITNPTTPTADFASQINFTSGSTATVVNASNIIWMGDNVSEIAGFVPRTNCRYTIDFVYDGSNIRGYIQGVSL